MHNYRYFSRDNSRVVSKTLAFDIIKRSCLTEKSSSLARNSYLTFIVGSQYNKCDIKKAFEVLYEQKVSDVKVIVKKHRKRFFKGRLYIRSSEKKAMVKFEDKEAIQQMFGGQQ